MTLQTDLTTGFNNLLLKAGKPIRVRYYLKVFGEVYDDDISLIKSGNDLWTSGIVLPMAKGTSDALTSQQGGVINYDQKLFVNGSLGMGGSRVEVKIGLGSPDTEQFSIIPDGAIPAEVEGIRIYKKVFLRRLTNGSLVGE